MVDRMDQQRPADVDRSRSEQNRGLARRGDQGNLSYYGGRMPSPFELMRRFSDDVDRMFASMGFGGMLEPWGISQRGRGEGRSTETGLDTMSNMAWAPSVDIGTRGNDLVVTAELPGIKPENVQIECDDNHLILSGETKDERKQEDRESGYYYSERNYGSFYRSIPLPAGVNADNARADFHDGVLEICFPGAARSLKPQRRRIEIQGAQQNRGEQEGQSLQTSQEMQSGQKINQSRGESSQTTP